MGSNRLDPGETPTLRAGLYGRASSDPKKRGRSVADQMTDNRRLCTERGWQIVDEYIDLDRSASRHARKVREDYERLIRDIQARKIDVVVAWEASRLQRDTSAYMRLRDECVEAGVLWCCNGTVLDMSNGSDRVTSIIMAAIAEKEADDIQRRNARTTRLAAERGTPHGKIPFGYLRKYDEDDGHLLGQFPHPERAEIVRDLFARAAVRESLSALTRLLRAYVPDTTPAGVRYLLRNRAYIGLRSHKGEEVTATWDAIVDEGLFWRVQEVLADPERRVSRDTRAVHLLSGIAECDLCTEVDAREGIRGIQPGYHDHVRYGCKRFGHVGVVAARLDAYVEEGLLTWLATPEAAAAFEPPNDGELQGQRSKLSALRGQLREARDLAATFDPVTYVPRLSAGSLADLEARMLPLIAETEAQVRRLSAVGDPVVDSLLQASPGEVQGAWDRLLIEQRRHAIRSLVRVTLCRAARMGDSRLDGQRVRMVFIGQEGFESRGRRTRGLNLVLG